MLFETSSPARLEQFRPVPGHEDSYIISDAGRVIRTKRAQGTRPGRILKPSKNHVTGYFTVSLSSGGTVVTEYLHRLVCAAFSPDAMRDGAEIHHANGDKSNNTLSNLRPVSRSENMREVAARPRP